ncbi:MAG: hypothetical protein R3279_10310 [Putridiphycobacter sp.]|nr:hypothetical protein [Putridiphycobacter sp.]
MESKFSFLCFLSCLFAFTNAGFAQQGKYISVELAGSGGFGSFNYEHPILCKQTVTLNMRYGFSMAPIDKQNGTNLIFPILLHGLIGRRAHQLDLAIGQAISITTKGSFFLSAPLACGYRYQPANKRFFIRLSYTPILSYLIDVQWQHWAGITYGFKLNQKK